MDRRIVVLAGFLSLGGLGCRDAGPGRPPAPAESWAVTAWGERYEVFAETGSLVAGASATSGAHVTVLSGFAPLTRGAVSVVLRDGSGREEVFRQEKPKRDGIFPVELKPRAEGAYDLVFRIESAAGPEDVARGARARRARRPRPAGPSSRRQRRRPAGCRS